MAVGHETTTPALNTLSGDRPMQTMLPTNDRATSTAIVSAAKKAGLSRPDAYCIDGEWRVTAGPIRTMYRVMETAGGYAFSR
jgi:hypothetical protein